MNRKKSQELSFHDLHIICKNSEIYAAQKFVQVQYKNIDKTFHQRFL